MAINVGHLEASVEIKEGAELYASLLELTELTRQHAELSRKISELSEFIRGQVDIQMSRPARGGDDGR